MSNIPTGTTLNGHSITYWNRQTEADGDAMSLDTIMPICSAINDNIKATETMQAATDVIDVFGTFSAFEENSGTLTAEGYLTDKDIIKVLEDESYSSMQVYYQYTSADNSWSAIGALDPYYSKSEIDVITANIETEISTNYLKADNVSSGKNITITKSISDDGPTITIGTKDDVSFNAVSSTGFSGMNISGNIKTATIDNLITSAEGGSAANAWINNNTTNNSANSAINATNADHTKDVITSYYATESQAGTQTATFNVSSLKLSGDKTAGVEISKTTYNNVDYLYFKLNSDTVCNFVEATNKYVKYTDTALNIGDTSSLGVTGAATALGKYTSANNYSFAIGFGDNAEQKTYASNKGVAIGDTNSASYNSFIIGHNNSALGSYAGQNKFIFGTNNEISEDVVDGYIIGSTNTATKSNSYIIGLSNSIDERAANNPTFVFGYNNNIRYSTQYFNMILGSYADVSNPDTDIFFLIGNGNPVKEHNALEISNTKMSYQPDGYKISFGQYGINTTYTADPQLDIYNYGFIPYRYNVHLLTTEPIYTSAIISKQYCMLTEDDINVYCDLFVCSPTETKSTEFRIKKFNIFGNEWRLYINIPKDYHILCNSTPGTGTTSSPVPASARWVSGFSDSDSNAGPDSRYPAGTIDTFYIYRAPDPSLKYKYVAYDFIHLNTRAYFDVNVDAVNKTVLFTKGYV